MIYFFFWVVFLLVVLLAVPIAAFLEKRKYRAEHPEQFVQEEPVGEEAGEEVVGGFEDSPGEAQPEFAEVEGGDDFSGFDDIE